MLELSQPQFAPKPTATGKMLIDKAPEGSPSPNLADAVKIRFAPKLARAPGFFDIPERPEASAAPASPAAPPGRFPRTFR